MSKLTIPLGTGLSLAKDKGQGFGVLHLPPVLTTEAIDYTASTRTSLIPSSSGTANTKGSWVQSVASLSADVYGVLVDCASFAFVGTNCSMLFDIGVGAAASEVVVVPDLPMGGVQNANANQSGQWFIPIFIPRGSRVSIRIASAVGGRSVLIRLTYFGSLNGKKPSDKIVAMGVVSAGSRGTVLTAPGSINTKGAWTQIIASTVEGFEGLLVSVDGGGATSQAGSSALLDIGMGASGSERVIIPDLLLASGAGVTSSWMISPHGAYPVRVPTGVRLAARYQASVVAGVTFGCALHGIRQT